MVKLVNSNLSYEPCGFVRTSPGSENAGYIFSSLFGVHPMNCCSITTNSKEIDERYKVIRDSYDDFVKSGYSVFKAEYANWQPEDQYQSQYDAEDADLGKKLYLKEYIMFDEENQIVINCEYGSFMVYTNKDIEYVQTEIFEKHIAKYIKDDGEVKCNIIAKSDYFYLTEFNIALKGDLDFGLYNEGFEEVHNSIIKSLNEDKNGLYIFHGAAGTGKTTYIRHLIKAFGKKKKFVYVPANLISDLTNPGFISFIIENKDSIFIVEDCESLVTVGTNGVRSSAIADMLNMTDGILADALQIKFICTFNTMEKEIDQALLRPGRCRMKYNFENLKKDRANAAAERLGLDKVDKDVSLAELFNGTNDYQKKKQKKIGF